MQNKKYARNVQVNKQKICIKNMQDICKKICKKYARNMQTMQINRHNKQNKYK